MITKRCVVYVKTKSSQPVLHINCNIQYRPITLKRTQVQQESNTDDEYDTDLFESINLLSGLSEGLLLKTNRGNRRVLLIVKIDPAFANQDPVQRFVIENHSRHGTGSSTSQLSVNPSLSLKRSVKETLPIRSGLMVKLRTTNASVAEKMVMMSIELENPNETGSQFMVEKIDVQVSNAVVSVAFNTPIQFPIELGRSDLVVFVYDVTLLDDGVAKPPTQPQRMFPSRRPPPLPQQQPILAEDGRMQPQRVSIQIYSVPVIAGVRAAPMRSKWNTMLDVSRQRREDMSPLTEKLTAPVTALARSQSMTNSPGTRSVAGSPGDHQQVQNALEGVFGVKKNSTLKDIHARRAPEREIADGIVVSFTVPNKIEVGKRFLLHVFIVNRSKHTRRFQVMIPNRKRYPAENFGIKTTLPPLPLEPLPIDPYMSESGICFKKKELCLCSFYLPLLLI